ncbi:MAG: alpha-L-fucosidase [Planctomycetota bacterium]
MCVLDLERGLLSGIRELPWQNDTSIGDWFWTDPPRYRSVDSVIDMLVDIVSKNGNLLMNVPPKADGTLDDEAINMLREMGRWMDINSEAIYGSRPWVRFGEGPTITIDGNFNDSKVTFTGDDIRFTIRGDVLYAFVMDWPADRVVSIKSLAVDNKDAGTVKSVSLLGHDGKIKWRQSGGGLEIELPEEKPCDYAFAFKMSF